MASDRERVRADAAKVSGTLAQQLDSSLTPAPVFNPEIVALGMVAELGAPAGSELGESLKERKHDGVVRVENKPAEDSDELRAARRSGSLERVLRVRREEQAAASQQVAEPDRPGKLRAVWDFSRYDDDELAAINPATLTPDSAEMYSQEIDQRLSLYSSPQDEEDEAVEVDEDTDYDQLFEQAGWEGEAS
jgi:hypothetical protein